MLRIQRWGVVWRPLWPSDPGQLSWRSYLTECDQSMNAAFLLDMAMLQAFQASPDVDRDSIFSIFLYEVQMAGLQFLAQNNWSNLISVNGVYHLPITLLALLLPAFIIFTNVMNLKCYSIIVLAYIFSAFLPTSITHSDFLLYTPVIHNFCQFFLFYTTLSVFNLLMGRDSLSIIGINF